jgi:hypothetical protein
VALGELGVRLLRLPVYWDEVEPEPGCYRWETLDWQMDAAAAAGARVLLCVGHRAPRYPECFAPAWACGLAEGPFTSALMDFVTAVVTRFRDDQALEAWQVENEPDATFLGWRFGAGCRDARRWLEPEIALVRTLDCGHPVVLSYANSPWFVGQLRSALRHDCDIVAVSVYERLYFSSPFYSGFVDQTRLGVIGPLSLGRQRRRAAAHGRDLWVSELQAEPWPRGCENLLSAPREEVERTMSRAQLLGSWGRVTDSGIRRAYLWGIEWLLARRQQGLDLDVLDLVRGMVAGECRGEASPYSSK